MILFSPSMVAPMGSTPTAASPQARGEVLAGKGRLLVEIGATQEAQVSGIFRAAGLKLDETASVGRDLAGRPRVVVVGA